MVVLNINNLVITQDKFIGNEIELCSPIPEHTPHAVSVSLPKWQDNVDYEEGNPRVVDKMRSGYPRFCLHEAVKQLSSKVIIRANYDGLCYCFPSRRVASECQSFIMQHAPLETTTNKLNNITIGEYIIPSLENSGFPISTLYVVLLPLELGNLAKAFWQHSGEIISSRYAEYCLKCWESNDINWKGSLCNSVRTQRYSKLKKSKEIDNKDDLNYTDKEFTTYFEERYGRNLSISLVTEAKLAMRRRIAAGLQHIDIDPKLDNDNISSDDVYLYPTGMSAIYNAHRISLAVGGQNTSICFGFPYTDTLKILQKFGPGCHFLGLGDDKDIETLETILKTEKILALICEFPSNPLLRSPPLRKIRELADKYDFLVIIDDTIGGLINLKVWEVADITVSSLTKIFSGDSNVMGGSLTLSPKSPKYHQLKQTLTEQYEDLFWCEDAIFLERNSRTFETRVRQINVTTERLCEFLNAHPLVKSVHYPKFSTPEAYNEFQTSDGGYGGLFSLEFHNPTHAIPFYDNLPCAKGPSLGTNFTLACPYTLLAHYTELDWAAQYNVNSHLVRISVGLEGSDWLKWAFESALNSISV